MSDELVVQAEDGMVGTTDDAGYRWYFDSTVTVGSKPMFTIDTPVKWIWESGGGVGPYPETHPATKAVLTSEWRNNERVYQIALNTKFYSSGDPDYTAKKQTCRDLFSANRMAPVGPDMGWSDPNFGNLRADSAIRGTLCLVVDGYEVVVPDVWWLLGHNFSDEWLYSWMFSNWCDYAPLRSELDAEQHVSMYGYRVKDNSPMVVDFTLHKKNGSAQANTSVKARPLYTDNVSTFLDEFNWKLAVKRLETDWGLDTSSFVKTDGLDDFKRVYLPFTAGSMDVQTVQVSDLGQQVQVHKDYAQQFTLRNQTDAPMVMKSSDYTIAIASTDTWSVSLSIKEAFSWSTKTTVKTSTKIKLPLPIEGGDAGEKTTEESTEKTFTKGFEVSETVGYTHTKTTTETFAFSGQTFTVPPKTDLQLNYDVYRGNMTGKIRILMDLPDDPHFKAVEFKQGTVGQGWLITRPTVSLDLAKAKEVLGLSKIYDSWIRDDKSIARGTLVAAIVNMTVDIGVIGHISVEPVKHEKQLSAVTEEEPRPVATLESLSIEMPLAVPLKGLVAPPPPTDLALKPVGDTGHSVDVAFRPGHGSDGLVKNWLLTIADHSFVVPLSAPGADGLVKARVRTLGSGLKTFTEYDAFVAGVTTSGTTAPSNTAKVNIR